MRGMTQKETRICDFIAAAAAPGRSRAARESRSRFRLRSPVPPAAEIPERLHRAPFDPPPRGSELVSRGGSISLSLYTTSARECTGKRTFVVGGYGRLCRVKDRSPCLRRAYAAVEIGRLLAKFSKCAVGSGPRGRWFKSTRPDQIFKNPQETGRVRSGSSLGFDAQIESREPSAPYFKRWPSEELFDTRS